MKANLCNKCDGFGLLSKCCESFVDEGTKLIKSEISGDKLEETISGTEIYRCTKCSRYCDVIDCIDCESSGWVIEYSKKIQESKKYDK